MSNDNHVNGFLAADELDLEYHQDNCTYSLATELHVAIVGAAKQTADIGDSDSRKPAIRQFLGSVMNGGNAGTPVGNMAAFCSMLMNMVDREQGYIYSFDDSGLIMHPVRRCPSCSQKLPKEGTHETL